MKEVKKTLIYSACLMFLGVLIIYTVVAGLGTVMSGFYQRLKHSKFGWLLHKNPLMTDERKLGRRE
jgi:hypothetical protein